MACRIAAAVEAMLVPAAPADDIEFLTCAEPLPVGHTFSLPNGERWQVTSWQQRLKQGAGFKICVLRAAKGEKKK